MNSLGNLIYPGFLKDSEIRKESKVLKKKSSVSMKHNHFKHLHRSRKKFSSIKDQLVQSRNHHPPQLRSISTQTDSEASNKCRCQEKRNSKVFSEDDAITFEKFHYKQQLKDDDGPMFALLIITALIMLLIAIYFLWNAKVPMAQIWSRIPNLPKRRKNDIPKFDIIFKFIGKLFTE